MNKQGKRSPHSPAGTAAPASREHLLAPPGRSPPRPAPAQPAPRSPARLRPRRSAALGDLSAEVARGSRVLLRDSADAVAGMCPNTNPASSPLPYIRLFPTIDVSLRIYLKTAQRRRQKVRIPRGTPTQMLPEPGAGELCPERRGTFSLAPGPGG